MAYLPGTVKKDIMRTRLLGWQRLFDKFTNLEEDKASITENAASESEVFQAVSKEHSDARKSICLEYGIIEEDVTVPQVENSKKLNKTTKKSPSSKCNKNLNHNVDVLTLNSVSTGDEEEESESDSNQIFDSSKLLRSTASKDTRKIACESEALGENEDFVLEFQAVSKEHSDARKSICLEYGIIEEDVTVPQEKNSKKVNKTTEKSPSSKCNKNLNHNVDVLTLNSVSTGDEEEESESDSNQIFDSSKLLRSTASKGRGKIASSKRLGKFSNYTKKAESLIKNIPQKLDLEEQEASNERNLKELVEEYELSKFYKRRKSRQFGSVYIVSNLNEELTEKNRYKHNFPAKMKKTKVFVKRRFILNANTYFWKRQNNEL